MTYKKLLLALLLVFVCTNFNSEIKYAVASLTDSSGGWAWGGSVDSTGEYQGIGWISFNDTNVGSGGGSYGVDIPPANGDVTGYAWSEHYGWLSFQATDLAGCSPALSTAERIGNYITGGARFIAIANEIAMGNNGGFDGCVSLAGADYGVTVSGNQLNGYAWSSDLGWIDMSGVAFTDSGANLNSTNAAPASGSTHITSQSITFSGDVRAGDNSFAEGGWVDLEIDWMSDGVGAMGDFDASFNANGGIQLGAFLSSEVKSIGYILPAGVAPAGTHRYRFHADTTNVLAEYNELDNYSEWVTFIVVPPPSVALSALGCSIPIGSSQCNNGNANWTFSYGTGPYEVSNTLTGTIIGTSVTSGGNVPVLMEYGTNRIEATDNGNLLGYREVDVSCGVGGYWIGTICDLLPLPPQIEIESNPEYIRSGGVAEIAIEIDHAYHLECMLIGASATPTSFIHSGTPVINTYRFNTAALTSDQKVEVQCRFGGTLVGTEEGRVNVLPVLQEL